MIEQIVTTEETEPVPQGFEVPDALPHLAERVAGGLSKIVVFTVDTSGHAEIKSFGDIRIDDIGRLGARLLQEAGDTVARLRREGANQ